MRDGVTYLKEREVARLRGKDAGQGRKSYKRRKRKNTTPILLYCTKKVLASIQRDLNFIFS